jgi:hypothetical protein
MLATAQLGLSRTSMRMKLFVCAVVAAALCLPLPASGEEALQIQKR